VKRRQTIRAEGKLAGPATWGLSRCARSLALGSMVLVVGCSEF